MSLAASKFDRMFDTLIGNEPASVLPAEDTGGLKSSCAAEVERQIQKAMALFHGGRYAHCLGEVRKVEDSAAEDPRVRALIGACNALVSGHLRPGIERCAEIIEQTFYIPDLYCTLGVLLLKSRRRAQAYSVFLKGLRIDPHHRALHARVREMGKRRKPVLRFLDRSHPANRALGFVRARLSPA